VVRERLAFAGETLTEGLLALHAQLGEGMILSTCNRTEIYAVEDGGRDARKDIFDFLSTYHRVPTHVLERSSYVHRGDEAVAHLFRVASGLDSLVLGEPQILSQIRDALAHAREAGAVGPVLQRLATDALRAGKRARTQTDISRNRISIAHAAVDFARHELMGLAGKRVVVLGAGKMASLTGKLLRAHDVSELMIVNRSLDRAQELAAAVGGVAVPVTGLAGAIAGADVVIGAVMVDRPMVSLPDILTRAQPLLMIDISVPRSIAIECELLPGVRVQDVDSLEPFAEETRRLYADEVSKVEALVDAAVGEFGQWVRGRSGVRAITALRKRSDEIRDAEVERTLRRLSHLSERDQNQIRALAHAVAQKLTHDPIVALREARTDQEAERILDTMGVRNS